MSFINKKVSSSQPGQPCEAVSENYATSTVETGVVDVDANTKTERLWEGGACKLSCKL